MEPTAFRQGSRFELLRTLGHGATGVVHEAFDHHFHRRFDQALEWGAE